MTVTAGMSIGSVRRSSMRSRQGMRVTEICVWLVLAEESHKPEPEHIERSQSGSNHANSPDHRSAIGTVKDGAENFVFAEEAGKWREAGNGNGGDRHYPESDRNFLAQSAHATHVLLTAHGVNHRACAKEQQCFKESVCHQMEDSSRVRCYATGQEHIAE